jgi:Holliday junction resolvase RusA-like endonuclease
MTVITLPFPISVNAMFADGKTRRHKSQRYAEWVLEAGWMLRKQRPQPVKGQVEILYEVQDGKDNRRRDLVNLEKGCTDLLVEHGIIEADHDLILREVRMKWNRNIEGVRITITPHINRVSETSHIGAANAGSTDRG